MGSEMCIRDSTRVVWPGNDLPVYENDDGCDCFTRFDQLVLGLYLSPSASVASADDSV